jgi:two-component system phosphate regulon response regulator PhoB
VAHEILIVDDDAALVAVLRTHLERAGFQCRTAGDADTGLRLARERRPDLVLLDFMLPGLSGHEACRRLRHQTHTAHVPIILMTGEGDHVDRIVGLELGADDYLTKPFDFRELVARVRAVLRRARQPDEDEPVRVGTLEIDTGRRQVRVAGHPVELTATEFTILSLLLAERGRVLSRPRLLQHLWGTADVEEAAIKSRTIDFHVSRLREKLGAEARRLVTARGVGYQFDIRE